MSESDFDVYRLDKKALGKYGEARLAEILSEKGWKVYEPAFGLDSYIDIVAARKKCNNCNAKNPFSRSECKECKKKIQTIYRTIQVKTSLREKGGTDKTFAFNLEPKDLLTSKQHFLVGMAYDIDGEEHSFCCTPSEYVEFDDGGTGIFNHTWKVGRGRFHPNSNCFKKPHTICTEECEEDHKHIFRYDIPENFIDRLERLEDEIESDIDIIIDKHEIMRWGNGRKQKTISPNDGFWLATKSQESYIKDQTLKISKPRQQKKLRANKKFLKETLVDDLENIVNLKTTLLQMIKNKKQEKPLHSEVKTKGTIHSSNKKMIAAFQARQEIAKYVFKSIKGNDYLSMQTRCVKCQKPWDREEKECYRCKTWQPPLKKCHVCKVIVPNDQKGNCPTCKKTGDDTRFKEICLNCDCEFIDGSAAAKASENYTYFTPITFCQNCGNREIKFVFEELT